MIKKYLIKIYFLTIAESKVKMPKPKNKKNAFIDKKNAVSFQLIHRSQQVHYRTIADRFTEESYTGSSCC